MTGFDPTAPERDTSDDDRDEFPDNVVPPEELTPEDVPARGTDTPVDEDGQAAGT